MDDDDEDDAGVTILLGFRAAASRVFFFPLRCWGRVFQASFPSDPRWTLDKVGEKGEREREGSGQERRLERERAREAPTNEDDDGDLSAEREGLDGNDSRNRLERPPRSVDGDIARIEEESSKCCRVLAEGAVGGWFGPDGRDGLSSSRHAVNCVS